VYLEPEISHYSFFAGIDKNKLLTYTPDRSLYDSLEAFYGKFKILALRLEFRAKSAGVFRT
jgi:hypothetical protein